MPLCARNRLEVSISERSATVGTRSPVACSTKAVSFGLGFSRSIQTASGIATAALPRSAGGCSVSPVRKWRVSIPGIVQASPQQSPPGDDQLDEVHRWVVLLARKPFLRVLL